MADYDAQLMLRVSRGEDAPFRELFDRNYRRAVNVAYRTLGDADLAEDIAIVVVFIDRHIAQAVADHLLARADVVGELDPIAVD